METTPVPLRNTQYTRIAYFISSASIILFAACTPQTTPSSTLFPTLPSTLSPTLSPTPSSIPPTPVLGPCSPLAALSLSEIPAFITQPFIAPGPDHDAEHPERLIRDDGHHGVDIGYYKRDGKLFTGTPVLAALDGRIAAIIHDRPPYGNMLMVETPHARIPPALVVEQNITAGDSLYTLYAHLQNFQPLTVGQSVACGEQLAQTGLTGFTGGPHLHFETRWGPPGATFPSMAYYRADATPAEMAAYEKWRMSGIFHLFDAMQLLKLP